MKKIEYDIPVYEDGDIADLKEYSEKMAEAIKGQVDKFGNPLIFKGRVEELEDLDNLTDVENGHIYLVKSENKNYIFNGTEWKEYSENKSLEAGDSLPVGTIVEFDGDTVPDGYEEVEENEIVISAVEPTENRKRVWMQKGKNLFDAYNVTITSRTNETYQINGSNKITVSGGNSWNRAIITMSNLKPNTKYTLSTAITNTSGYTVGISCDYAADGNHNNVSTDANFNSYIIFNTDENGKVVFHLSTNFSNTIQDSSAIFDNIQVEQNLEPTDYEEYIKPKIYIKNENDVYEEFISKEKMLGNDILNNFYGFKKEYYHGITFNCNDIVSSGIYTIDVDNTITNKPPPASGNIKAMLVMNTYHNSIVLQIWFDYNAAVYYRWKWWGAWGSWKQITIT